jgi:hypothetical protein
MKTYKVMQTTGKGVFVSFRHVLVGMGLLGAGFLAGSGAMPPSEARGEVTIAPPPKAFETGGQLSVPILKEMSATLHQMDARLARMETVASLLQAELQLGQHKAQ